MKKILIKIKIIMAIISGVVIFTIRYNNRDMSETRLFIEYAYIWIILMICIMVIGYFDNR